jgi:hypothetical protein
MREYVLTIPHRFQVDQGTQNRTDRAMRLREDQQPRESRHIAGIAFGVRHHFRVTQNER